jgi:hypothetical protein
VGSVNVGNKVKRHILSAVVFKSLGDHDRAAIIKSVLVVISDMHSRRRRFQHRPVARFQLTDQSHRCRR